MANVLTLKSVENSTATCDFVVIGIPDDKYPTLNDSEVFNSYIKDNLKRHYDKSYTSYGIIYQGNLLKFFEYPKIIDKLPKRGHGGTTQYRDYTKTYEQQLKASVNIAEDSTTCWNTVRTALGARNPRVDCFGIVLEVINNK